MKINEQAIRALPVPDRGNKVHYFPDAIIQGVPVPRGFGVRVTAAGVRSFVLNYRSAHVERRLTIGQWPTWSVLLAVREARELRQRIDRGEDPLADRRAVEAAADNALRAICEEYQRREGGRLRSADWKQRILERLVYPALGARQIGDIKRTDIVRLLDRIEDENGAVMADRTLAIMRKVMNWHASRSDDFRSPIVRGMARTKTAERARSRILSDDELRAVWRAAEAQGGPFGRLVRFLLLTGARRSEAAEMTWSELAGADWTLPASRNKTKVDLVRPLSAAALEALPPRVPHCNWVFPGRAGRRPVAGFSRFRDKLEKQAGVSDFTLHDLRRTARSLLSRVGVASDHAERCLGHVIGGVRGVYDRHEYHREKQLAYEALAAQIERILNPPPANVTPLHEQRARA
jgi:integrase